MNQLTLGEYDHEKQMENLYPILGQLIAATENSSLLQELKDVIINFLVQRKSKISEEKKTLEKEIEEIWALVELQEDSHNEL